MAYTPTTWVDGSTPINAENLNKLEQAVDANDALLENHEGRLDTVEAEVDTKLAAAAAGAPLGVATLDANGHVPAAQLPAVASIPTGGFIPYGGDVAPAGGWLICDGSAVSRATYAALFSVFGTRYGAGDGSSTFNLPDYRGRTLVGKGTHPDVDSLADNEGVPVGDRRPRHRHSVNDPGHAHSVSDPGHSHYAPSGPGGTGIAVPTASSAPPTEFNQGVSVSGTGIGIYGATTGITVGPQTNTPVDGPAYGVANWLVKT